MLFRTEQMKHLETDGDEKFRFVDSGNVTDKEKAELLEIDSDFFDIYNEHIITNYEELKK